MGSKKIESSSKIILTKQWENRDCLLALRKYEKQEARRLDDASNPVVQEYLSDGNYERRVQYAQNVWNGAIESAEFAEFVSVIETGYSETSPSTLGGLSHGLVSTCL